MTNVNEREWEHDLAELLGDLTTVQTELLDVLSAKRAHIARDDLSATDELHARMEQLLERMQECHDRRAQLLQRVAQTGAPAKTLTALVARTGGAQREKLGKQVKESGAWMRLLQHESLANWVLAQRSLLHVAQMLEIIATGGRLQPTYGQSEPTLSGGALVDQVA